MKSPQLFFVEKMIRHRVKRRLGRHGDVLQLRPMMHAMGKQNARPPRRIVVTSTLLGGVPAEVLEGRGTDRRRAILYVHGGGFVAGSPLTHRPITWRLADLAHVPVYVPDYRLAPEHPYPAGLEDAITAYRALLARGIDASRIVVAGDSAGGNLTLALALALKARGLPLPAALICLSPTTELFEDLPSHRENVDRDAMFPGGLRPGLLAHYCPTADDGDALVSPLRGELAGLPPTLFHCAEGEILRDDSVFMAKRMKEAGVDVTIDVWPHSLHVWHVVADVVPEAKKALSLVGDFARKHLFA